MKLEELDFQQIIGQIDKKISKPPEVETTTESEFNKVYLRVLQVARRFPGRIFAHMKDLGYDALKTQEFIRHFFNRRLNIPSGEQVHNVQISFTDTEYINEEREKPTVIECARYSIDLGKWRIDIQQATSEGKKYENMDFSAVIPLDEHSVLGESVVYVCNDGVGTRETGGTLATIAADYIQEFLESPQQFLRKEIEAKVEQNIVDVEHAKSDDGLILKLLKVKGKDMAKEVLTRRALLTHMLREVQLRIIQGANGDRIPIDSATTCSVAVMFPDGNIITVNIGDTPIFVMPKHETFSAKRMYTDQRAKDKKSGRYALENALRANMSSEHAGQLNVSMHMTFIQDPGAKLFIGTDGLLSVKPEDSSDKPVALYNGTIDNLPFAIQQRLKETDDNITGTFANISLK